MWQCTQKVHKVKKRCNYNWQNRPPVLNHSGDQVLQLPPEKEKQNIRFGPPVRIVCFSFVVPIMYVTYMSWISSHLAHHQMKFSGHIKVIFAHHQLYSPGLDSWSFCVFFKLFVLMDSGTCYSRKLQWESCWSCPWPDTVLYFLCKVLLVYGS